MNNKSVREVSKLIIKDFCDFNVSVSRVNLVFNDLILLNIWIIISNISISQNDFNLFIATFFLKILITLMLARYFCTGGRLKIFEEIQLYYLNRIESVNTVFVRDYLEFYAENKFKTNRKKSLIFLFVNTVITLVLLYYML